jgi:hypothetical protein
VDGEAYDIAQRKIRGFSAVEVGSRSANRESYFAGQERKHARSLKNTKFANAKLDLAVYVIHGWSILLTLQYYPQFGTPN